MRFFKKKTHPSFRPHFLDEKQSAEFVYEIKPAEEKGLKTNPYSGSGIAILLLLMIAAWATYMAVQTPKKTEDAWHYIRPEKPYEGIGEFHFVEGKALVKAKEMEKYGFIDQKYDLVIPLDYDLAWHFQNGRALVEKAKKMGYINHEGREEIPCIYKAIRAYQEGFYAVYLEHKGWGYLNWEGDVMIPYAYRDAQPFSEGLAAVEDARHYWGYINPQGKNKIPFKFDEAADFKAGLAAVKFNNLWGFIDKMGNWVIKPQFEYVLTTDFSGGKVKVRNGGKTFYIDKNGEKIEVESE